MEFFSHERGFVCKKVFFLIGTGLLNMQKIDSLNRPNSVSFKQQKL